MASSLYTLRETRAAALTAAGLRTFPEVPEQLVPPAALLLPDEPYITEDGVTQCHVFAVNLRLVVVAARGTNAAMADQLDGLIATALGVLDTGENGSITVAEPVEVEANGAVYLGTTIRFTTLHTIGATP